MNGLEKSQIAAWATIHGLQYMISSEINPDLKFIFEQFKVSGTFNNAAPFGNGHINRTFLVKTKEISKPNYILQQINHHVFTDPLKLQENLVKITQYLGNLKDSSQAQYSSLEFLKVYPTHEGRFWFQDSHKDYWRIMNFIEGANSYDLVKNTTQAFQAGITIGHFQKSLVNFPVSQLNDTIPNFHNLQWRLDNFDRSLHLNALDRAKSAPEEITFIQKNREKLLQIHLAGKTGDIPLRVTHNDTKFNNILLNKKDQAISLIDLDTVMGGMVHFDFGDAIRIIANKAEEDTKDLSQIQIDFSYLEAFIRGYFEEAKDFLAPKEIELLPDAPAMMTFMLGVRFLTDYLSGDKYFKIHYDLHNLQRTKVQFALVDKFMDISSKISNLILNFS